MDRFEQRRAAERFIAIVEGRAGDVRSGEDSVRVTNAVLVELGRRLTGGVADRLADSLPVSLGAALRQGSGQGGSFDGFLADVAKREQVDDMTAVTVHVEAVFRAVAEMADPEAVESARDQLTAELRRLWTGESDAAELLSTRS